MVRVLFAEILDTKVVDNEGESVGIGGVIPERRSSGNRGEYKMSNTSFDPVVGNSAGLFEARHAFSVLEVNSAVRTECAEVVLFGDLVRDTGQREFHVLVASHGGDIVKILDIQGHEAGTGSGDGDVK